MAAGDWQLFGAAIERIAKGEIDFDAHTFRALLTSAGYTPDLAAHDDLADVTNELAGGDYARVALAGLSVTRSGTSVKIDCNDISFGTNVTLSAKWCLVFDDSHAGDALVAALDLNTASGVAVLASTNGLFQITIDAAGWIEMAPPA
ncbi:MAG: hypothetical protein IT561_01960 [Alphaproteobacteria bacterium]|nr:hypothetical protein [Alphaproteobacteria bacterium]